MTNLFDTPVSILALTSTKSGYGGLPVESWATPTTTTTRGTLIRPTAKEVGGDYELQVRSAKLLLPPGTTITTHNRVTVDGDTYEVQGVANIHDHHIRVALTVLGD